MTIKDKKNGSFNILLGIIGGVILLILIWIIPILNYPEPTITNMNTNINIGRENTYEIYLQVDNADSVYYIYGNFPIKIEGSGNIYIKKVNIYDNQKILNISASNKYKDIDYEIILSR